MNNKTSHIQLIKLYSYSVSSNNRCTITLTNIYHTPMPTLNKVLMDSKTFFALGKLLLHVYLEIFDIMHPELIFWLCQWLELTWSLLYGELSQAQEQVSLLNESGSKQWAGVTLKHWQPHSSCSSRTSSWNDKCTFNHMCNSRIHNFKIFCYQKHNSFFWSPEKKFQLF